MAEAGKSSTSTTISINASVSEESDEMALYKKDALAAVTFKIVYDDEDFMLRKLESFKPDMAHQIFGESESIFGYRSLSITLHYLHNSANAFVDIRKSDKIEGPCKADDIMEAMHDWMPKNFVTNREEFLEIVNKENHDTIYGTVIHESIQQNKTKIYTGHNCLSTYKITVCDTSDKEFLEFHKRFETLIIWFIDAANFIDFSDKKWMLFYIYEEFVHPVTKILFRSPIGFCTVYQFYAYPAHVRPRISQFFILPTHQKRGLGTKMYGVIVEHLRNMSNVIDITIEEPTPIFQKIRDFVDCSLVMKNLSEANVDVANSNSTHTKAVMKTLKLCKRQCQRLFDILLCYNANKVSLNTYCKTVANIKKRIETEAEKDFKGSKRLCNLERAGVYSEPADRKAIIEAESKKYIESIEPSVKYLETHIN